VTSAVVEDVATVLISVVSCVEVEVRVEIKVVVSVTVDSVVTTLGLNPRMLPTTQPFVDDTIQTAFSGSSMPVIGCANTRVHVKPFQNRITGSPPWIAPTAQPSTEESM
jgi:hypothetical protein